MAGDSLEWRALKSPFRAPSRRGVVRGKTAFMIQGFLEPGVLVRNPHEPQWGLGQVQSIDDYRVTVTFEEAGKRVIDARHIDLDYVGPDPRGDGQGI